MSLVPVIGFIAVALLAIAFCTDRILTFMPPEMEPSSMSAWISACETCSMSSPARSKPATSLR